MSEPLSGKVVLVTGGAKRVGAAIARRLHREGANLMLHYRGSEREARALRAELNAARADSVALIQADLLDLTGLPEIVRNTVGRFERLDVRVNGVAPGAIIWPEDGSWDDLTRQRIVSHTLLRRTGDPDDVARAVYYLIAEAPYVTGQIIAVDGGRSINI